MDPEREIRNALVRGLSPYFEVLEEVSLLTRSNEKVRADLLLSTTVGSSAITIAVEIKSQPPKQPKNYRDTFYQAYQYVEALTADQRLPERGINFALIRQDRPKDFWTTSTPNPEYFKVQASSEMDGIEMAFNTLEVGCLMFNDSKPEFRFGPNCAWNQKDGWKEEFYRRKFHQRFSK